jgi:hypothetical protein
MITNTSMTNGVPRADLIGAAGQAAPRPVPPRRDLFSSSGAAQLRAELLRQPEIRPEVVARGRALAADPSYPPLSVVTSVARQILAAPDLSNDES